MNITRKLIILFLLISLVPIAAISFFSYTTARESIVKQVVNQLSFVAAIQENRINTIINQDLERLDFVSSQTNISNLLTAATGSGVPAHDEIKTILQTARSSNKSFKDIFVLNPKGEVIASTEDKIVGQNFAREEFFVRGKTGNSIANFFFDEQKNLRVYLSGPIHAEDNFLGVVVVIESDVDNLMTLIRDYSGLGKSGEVLLARRDPFGNAIFIAPSRFHANSALRNIVKKDNTDDPMIQALSSVEHIIPSALDYRGKQVIAATRYIEATDWGLVVKMDRDEAFAPIYQLANYFLYTALITSFVAILNAWFFAQTLTKPIQDLTRFAQEVQKGDLNQHVNIASRDEIGLLSAAFNEMVRRLRLSYAFLEDKIREKTKELAVKVQETQHQLVKMESLLESIGDGVIATDAKEIVILINSAACEMLGIPSKNALGKDIKDVIRLGTVIAGTSPNEKNPIAQALINRRKITTTPTDGYSFTRFEGTKLPVAITVTPVLVNAELIGTILVFRDVTIPREIDRMKNEFISLASHQLRTPLSAIKWFVGILLTGDAGKITDEQKEMVENIAGANQRMIYLVNSLLNISRIESGRLVITPVPTQLSDIVKAAIADMSEQIAKKTLHVTVSIQPDLPTLSVDPKIMREVFNNLINNAVKYIPLNGHIAVSISQKDNDLITEITDTGYGIPKTEQGRVFEKFYRGENILSKDTEGSGLGLYLVKQIVQSSGGTIWFQSRENHGTTFRVSLPISKAKAEKSVPRLQES